MFDTPQECIEALKAGVSMRIIEDTFNLSHRRTMLRIEPVHELEMKTQEIRRIK